MEENFTLSFEVSKSPQEVFAAINNVRGWWSQLIEGKTDEVGAVFYYHFQDLHQATIKVAELEPGKKVVWNILNNHFSFTKDQQEWTGNDVIFEINENGDKTELKFTHVGLTPKYECYGACSEGWGNYILGSLKQLIETGKGEPNVGEAATTNEKELSK